MQACHFAGLYLVLCVDFVSCMWIKFTLLGFDVDLSLSCIFEVLCLILLSICSSSNSLSLCWSRPAFGFLVILSPQIIISMNTHFLSDFLTWSSVFLHALCYSLAVISLVLFFLSLSWLLSSLTNLRSLGIIIYYHYIWYIFVIAESEAQTRPFKNSSDSHI